ncbi:MAG: chromosome segregation protein SMC [Nanoarchaeota archaeon]|nr:chromosome segregation protein SMC [Nanoarchaeota archaeon]|tara:strand:+ start:178 stop:3606 length:3429 start_codon:yes stop_codon:yes gene_type:complete
MTVIKRIKATGFKSFAKPTELHFGNDFSGVIGPNGSGKSNVVDSLCFVLGRLSAKSLRANKAANLIYNGGKTGNAAKSAEVSIVFDNKNNDFPVKAEEIEIKRILNQKGNSTYKINNETRTRQQVLEVLGSAKINPDGHNIVLQGDITHMADMPSEERRKVVEDISGISVFEDKKDKAMKELEKVDSRLSETEIIMTERETYLKELKKDRDQALKYKDLEKNTNRNKATYYSTQIRQKEDKVRDLESRSIKNQKDIDRINSNIDSFRKEIEEKTNTLNQLTERIESKGPGESLTTEIENLKETLLRQSTRIDSIKNEINRINQRKQQLKTNVTDSDKRSSSFIQESQDLKNKLQNIAKEKEVNLKNLEKFKSSNNLGNIEKELSTLDSQIDNIKNILTEAEETNRLNLREKDQLSFKLKNLDDSINKAGNKEQIEKLQNLKSQFSTTSDLLNKELDESSSLTAQLSNARNSLYKHQEDEARFKAREVSIKESSGSSLALKKIKELNLKGIHGIVSELGEADKKYSMALEIAAGARINSVVVETDEVASKCIKYLKDNKLGVATFLPLNKIKSRPPVNISQGHGLATNLVKFDSKYKDVFNYVFGNTLIVDNINSARKIGIGKIRMATLEGDLVESSGAMIGGYRSRKFGSFKETGFQDKLENLDLEISRLRSVIQTLDKRKLENESKIDSLRETKANSEASIIKIEQSLPNIDIKSLTKERQLIIKELDKINKILTSTTTTISTNNEQLQKLSPLRTDLSKKIASKQSPELMKKLEDLERAKDEITEREIQYTTRISNIEAQMKDMLAPEKENILRIMKEHDKEVENFNSEVQELTKSMVDNKRTLKERQAKEKKLYSGFKQLFAKRNKLNEEIQKKELRINNEENKTQLFQDRINNYSNEKAKVISETAGLKQEFEPYKNVQLRKGITYEQLKDEIYKFERLMRDMGNVNLRSLEIYNEVHKEYEQILNKVSKLKSEKEDVIFMIQEVESKKSSVFLKTFNEISRNFENIFSKLTTKGTAHLVLEDQENPLEGGVQILVKITTNKYLDIKSLSGGEKTMTALALIFAIQEHDPASFYVFDEVDAALDKRNSEKLANLVKQYSDKAQYIVITHNDSVIHTASNLYGVSMRENGISNVVSLKV